MKKNQLKFSLKESPKAMYRKVNIHKLRCQNCLLFFLKKILNQALRIVYVNLSNSSYGELTGNVGGIT
jgi:hypothetical protein